jgi:DNA-3-methyladenine glycosylase
MLNVVTEARGFPAAVLIRAIVPQEGLEVMQALRPRPARTPARLTDGPAKLAQALAVDRCLNGHDLCARAAELFIERAPPLPDSRVRLGPRIGLNNTPEPWKSRLWNYRVVET